MSYTLEVRIHGIIGLYKTGTEWKVMVPDTLLGNPAPGRHRPQRPKKAMDGDPLYRHDPYLAVGQTRIYLRGHQVTFNLPGQPAPVTGALSDILFMKEVAGDGRCAMADTYKNGDPDKVSGMLTLDRGTISVDASPSMPTVKVDPLPATGSGQPGPGQEGKAPTTVVWRVDGFADGTALRITAAPLAGGSADPVEVEIPAPPAGGTLTVMIMNHRADSRVPDNPEGGHDPDFRWFYEFLATRQEIAQFYRRNQLQRLPIPLCIAGCPPEGTGPVPGPPSTSSDGPHVQSVTSQDCRPCEFC